MSEDRYAALEEDRFAELAGSFVDMDGNPMSVRAWAMAYEDYRGRTLAEQEIIGRSGSDLVGAGLRTEIRTMWTGVIDGQRPFGTTVGAGADLRVLQEYDSKAEALAGHQRWVDELSMGGPR